MNAYAISTGTKPLGNPETWESSLKTCVRIILTSPQPMFVWWGDELINIYNDAYRDVLGDKHPDMLGVSGKIVWKEIWTEVWPRAKIVFENNEGTFDDALLLIMNRYGYDEETYFKFSYNPIPGTKKTTEGLFCVCTEETQRIINERALDTLRKIGAINFTEKSLDIIYRNVAEALANNNKDFPFALIHKITGDANLVTVATSTGIDKSQNVFPDNIDITKPTAITKDFCQAFRENKIIVSEIKAEDITLPTGAWQTSPKQFIYLPVGPAGGKHPYCIISAALNPYRKFDEKYLQFCQLIGNRVSIEINKMLALEIEAKRAEALAEIDRAKIVFFSNISHEFRTPLTLMLSPLEEILYQKKNNLNKSEKQNIEIAQRNGMRLLKLVNTLLDFSNIEKGKQQAEFSLVDIVALTKNLAANFRAVIEKAGMKLIVKADTIIQPVYVDKQMWEKIVFNLLSNAFKYTLKGKITVELSAEKYFVMLKVKDTGVGIPENELPKMFDRFHRIQNVAGRTFEGTGIGLSLIKELVQLHHGEISVDSVLNKGSVFAVKIPFGKKHITEHQILKTGMDADEITSDIYVAEIETLLETEKKEALKIASVKEKNNFPTILVVDDNADMREHISSILSNNFNVITANNGMDALHKMKETIPALVLADIMMPVMDGIGLLKEIKNNKAIANIPVIFLTARAGEESRVEGWETGADDYLVKPFSSKELLSRVKAQIKMVKMRQSLQGNLRNILLEAPALICVLRGPEHVYELANEMYLKLIGNRDIIGKPIRKALPELEGQGFYELLDNVYTTGTPFIGKEIPSQLDKGNGKLEEVYLNFVYQPSHNSEGEIDGILVHGVEVTEQVLARKKIEESEKKFEAAILAVEGIIWTNNANGEMIGEQPGWANLTGQRFEEYQGYGWSSAVHPDDTQPTLDAWNEAVKNKITFEFEHRVNTKQDGWRFFSVKAVPAFDKNDSIQQWVGVHTDITEQREAVQKIKASQEQFHNLIFSSPSAIGILQGEDLIITTANEPIIEIWGKGKEIMGKKYFEALPELAEQGYKEVFAQVYKTGIPFTAVETPVSILQNRETTLKYYNFILYPQRNINNEVNGIGIIATEVTSQAIFNNKIKESEERFRSLAQTLPQLVWVTDAQGNAEFASIRWKEYTGIEPGGEKEWKAIVHPDDYDNINAAWLHSLTTGDMYTADVRLKSKDGQYRWHAVRGEPVFDKENKIAKWVGAFTDFHEQKEAAERIKESEKQFSTLANNIQNLAWIADGKGWIYWYNQQWYNYTGTTLEEMKGWGWEKVHHPDHIERVVEFVKQVWNINKPWELIFPLRGSDGLYRTFLTRAFPLCNEEGQIINWIGTNTDIEEQKIKEEKKDEFISIASHELKTPLTTAKAYLQLLEFSLVENNEDAMLYAKKASESVNRLNELISELLDVSKIRLGKLNYNITVFDFNEMIDNTVENIQLTTPTHIIIKSGKVCDEVTGDKDRLQQVVINLLTNAIKYSLGAEKIFITVEQENEMIKVSVKDSGIGMSKESLKKIFDKYHRIEEHAVHFQGLGIGLFISYEIIQRHHGKLWAESEQGKGSTFYFTLPLSHIEPAQ